MIHALTYWGTNKNKRAPSAQKWGNQTKRWGEIQEMGR